MQLVTVTQLIMKGFVEKAVIYAHTGDQYTVNLIDQGETMHLVNLDDTPIRCANLAEVRELMHAVDIGHAVLIHTCADDEMAGQPASQLGVEQPFGLH
jgi:hypothetical protein